MVTHVDERLLTFLPFYREIIVSRNPDLEDQLSDEVLKDAMVSALVGSGQAKRIQQADGTVRVEPTKEYLESISDA